MSTLRIKAKDTKSGINAEAARNKRAGHFTRIRQQERDATLESRRRRHNSDVPENGDQTVADDEQIELDRPNIMLLVESLAAADDEVVADAACRLRQLLSLINDPPFDEVVQAGALPRLVNLLSSSNFQCVFEAAWCLTNVASGTAAHTRNVVDAGAIPPLVELLSSTNPLVRDQAVWALGNIAGESPTYRDHILGLGAMPRLLAIAHQVQRLCMLRNVSWTLSNFCRGRDPQPDFSIVSTAFPTLHNMLNFRDDDIIADAAWTLSFLSDDTGKSNHPEHHKIEAVLYSGVLNRLVVLLSHQLTSIKTPTLRTIGNLLTGSNYQTQMVLNCNVLPPLISLLSSDRNSIRREAAWALSNIAAGTHANVESLVEANAFHALFNAVGHAQIATKREIAWVILNAVAHRSAQVLEHIAGIGWISGLLNFLMHQDVNLVLIALDALHHFLEFGSQHLQTDSNGVEYNTYTRIIQRANGDAIFEKLLDIDHATIIAKASTMMEKYLGFVERDDYAEEGGNAFETDQGMVGFDESAVGGDAGFDF